MSSSTIKHIIRRHTEILTVLLLLFCEGVLGFAEMTVKRLGDLRKGNKTAATTEIQNAALEVETWCNNIVVNSKHIRDILDNVLDLSKLETGTLKLCQEHMKVSELASEIHLLLSPTVRVGVLFAIEVIPADLVIVGDRQRWKQLLVNLLSNAIKFTHEGEVKLHMVMVEDQRLLVQVCDNGVGIGLKEQKSLFQKYEQAKSNSEKGTGLGLVIAQRIATLLGSKIQIESPWSASCISTGNTKLCNSPAAQEKLVLSTNTTKPTTNVITSATTTNDRPFSCSPYAEVVVEVEDGSMKIRGTRFHLSVENCIVEESSLALECETEVVAEAKLKDGLRFLVSRFLAKILIQIHSATVP
jgi:signal transduction histidine kinase